MSERRERAARQMGRGSGDGEGARQEEGNKKREKVGKTEQQQGDESEVSGWSKGAKATGGPLQVEGKPE